MEGHRKSKGQGGGRGGAWSPGSHAGEFTFSLIGWLCSAATISYLPKESSVATLNPKAGLSSVAQCWSKLRPGSTPVPQILKTKARKSSSAVVQRGLRLNSQTAAGDREDLKRLNPQANPFSYTHEVTHGPFNKYCFPGAAILFFLEDYASLYAFLPLQKGGSTKRKVQKPAGLRFVLVVRR